MDQALGKEYFDWLCYLVNADGYSIGRTFEKLLCRLHETEFYYLISMDANRAGDGINMRYHFKCDQGLPSTIDILQGQTCSVLEMMVGLAVRCENQIMFDPEYGDRTSLWFWNMIHSLGLSDMDDDHFDSDYVDAVLFRFLERDYEPNGKGGLFTVDRPGYDLRDFEIWYQMNWYLSSIV